MQVFFFIAYIVVGFSQLFAIIDGLEYALGLHWLLAGMFALFITYIPLLGSIIGVYGAVNVWDWSLLQASALFFWYVPVFLLIFLFGGVASLFDRR
jgi:hypothetical protein